MKKFIFGCVLMLCGAICGTGWIMAYTSLVQPGAWTSVTNIFPIIGFGRFDGYIVMLFYILAAVGSIIAIKAMGEDWKQDK